MKSQGKFKYKCLEKKDAGTFVNDKGQKIDYPAKYILKVDEIGQDGIEARGFKVAIDSTIVPKLVNIEPYSDVIIDFDIQFTKSGAVTITPADVKLLNK